MGIMGIMGILLTLPKLILLRTLFVASARQSLQAASALA